MPAKNSEIRSYLLRFAKQKGMLIREYVSDQEDGPFAFYCHIQEKEQDPKKTATAVSYQHFDNALVMAFLAFGNPEITFLDSD